VRLSVKLAVALVACLVMAMQTTKASAAVITNDRVQFVTFPVNTCNGEFVPVLGGVAHVVQRVQPDGSFVATLNGHFVSVGTLGNQYELNWQERTVLSPDQSTFTSRQLIVSKGPAPNHIVTFVIDFTTFTFTATERCFG